MPRESTKKAARDWLALNHLLGHPLNQALVDRLAAALEDHARSWAKELNLAWDRRGERPEEPGPGVPVLQPQFDELLEELARYQRAVETAGPDVPPGLLVIAVAELKKRLARLEAAECELCGARFPDAGLLEEREDWGCGEPSPQCHPCVENQRLRDLVAATERDFKDAAGDLPVDIPEPGTLEAKLLAANVLMRRQVADLLVGEGRGDRLLAAEQMLKDLREVATTADEERQSQILRRWGLTGGALTPHGVLVTLLEGLVHRSTGFAKKVVDCDACGGEGDILEEMENPPMRGVIDCQACAGTGRVSAGRS